ncbi:MAG: hypothetical protein F9K40_12555 [Kofleriaceae bacterium]|nr:MAG: hypothetical protein F9K40_12555 [Kofleriaceae bacterium]MBZ0238435.1 hypothetical protein [Kofleriaceae bacterium]
MKTLTTLIAALAAAPFLITATASARAETEPVVRDDAMPAISGGIEIVVGVSAAKTVGDAGGGMDAGDLVGSATEVAFELGRRVTPNLTLGLYSTAQGNAEGSTATRDVYTGAAGLEADFHLRPGFALDPWISVGAGLRGLLVDEDGYTILVGAELARVQLGLDLRVNEHIALAPVVGATATLYGAQKTPMADFAELTDKGIEWTFSAGVAGRFNVLGTRR